MAGNKCSKDFLNKTLLFIVKLLIENNITDWFIGYGTLLGVVRENSCIDQDDDIDIIIHNIHYDVLKKCLQEHGFVFEYGYDIGNSTKILKTKQSQNFASIDFYMASIDNKGNFHDEWEGVHWSNCYDESKQLIQRSWNNVTLNLPNNYEDKLIKRYGHDWRVPRDSWGTGNKNL